MKKETVLRNQIFISIAIAIAIIIGASIYLFSYFSSFNKSNISIGKNVQKQLDISTKLNYYLFKAINEAEIESNNNDKLHYYISLSSKNLEELKSITPNLNDSSISDFIGHTESIINITLLSQVNLNTIDWINEHEKTVLAFNNYIGGIIAYRDQKLADNESKFNTIKNNTIICIILCLLITIFVVYKLYVAIKNLENSGDELKRLNQELDEVKFNIENTNWILENNTLITDNIRGIDETNKIGKLVIQTLNEILPLHAATIYIREPNTNEFKLVEQLGTNRDQTIKVFQLGEGYLGKQAEDQKMTINSNIDFNHLNTTSSLIQSFKTVVFICPLVHDQYCLGLLEAAVQIQDDNKTQTLYDFFLRISNTIASKIKFGQSHILVKQLLLETQRQTEELETQQEELRITNEELIYKTNLLEASEEELSAQQEELSQINAELIKKAQELEKRNTELNITQKIVEQKIKEVEQASEYKTEFMANMSHELRTPLNSILILAKLLEENKLNNLTPEQIKYASVIHSAGSDLLELINDILDLAKIEAGKIELNKEVINTKLFCNKIQELFAAISKEKEINFQTSIHPTVPDQFVSDEYRLEQIIKNFLSNAFKFTEKDGNVCFSISLQNDQLSFEVKDTGKGISKEKQKLIFEAFKQEDGSTSRKYGGTGLGLSISKQIASLLNGDITLDSSLGMGSTFTVTIPLEEEINEIKTKEEKQQEPPIQSDEKIKNTTKSLLIVEDDINFADTLKSFAEQNGFTPYIAHDGLKGIELAEKLLPDAVILDVLLPLKDGWEVLKALKNNTKTQHIPIHMMSGNAYDKNELLKKGVISFMHKPVTREVIQKTFNHINSYQTIKKILLIENPDSVDYSIKNSLTKQNTLITQAYSDKEAIEQLNNHNNIDCIIINLNSSSDINLDLIEKIRSISNYFETPIIIYSDQQLTDDKKNKILSISGPTILKDEKLNDKLLDEVDLFLSSLKNTPINSNEKLKNTNGLKGKTALIADDDMRNIFALSTSLENYEMKIEVANTGKEAIEILKNKSKQIDIVLMDIMMPVMDGYEAIQKIRNELHLMDLPIIAVTAKAMKGDRDKTIENGANDYISKPIDVNKLISLMNIWIS